MTAYPDRSKLVRTDAGGKQPDGPNGPIGFFGGIQGATPKYARNNGRVDDDFRETMARFFIKSGASAAVKEARIRKLDLWLQPLARQIYGNGYIDFILQSVQTGLAEKMDLTENLSDGYTAYYLGQAPTLLQCSGVLVNSQQDDQVVSMVGLYTELIRGTKLAEHGETLRFRYDSFLYTGTLNNMQWSLGAENELFCPFNFTFLVKRRQVLPSPIFKSVSLRSAVSDIESAADAVGSSLTPQKVTGTAPTITAVPAAVEKPSPTDAVVAEAQASWLEAMVTTATKQISGGFFENSSIGVAGSRL